MVPFFTFVDPLLFSPLLLQLSLPSMHPAPVSSHTVQSLVFRVALLTHVALVGLPMSCVHVVPYVRQLVACVTTPQALIQPISLSEGLNFFVLPLSHLLVVNTWARGE